jgi:hypothetical protein
MKSWKPHIDLARLLEALSDEIVAATEEDVRRACLEDGRSIAVAANEVRRMIGAVTDDSSDPDANVALVEPAVGREPVHKQH